MKKIKPSTRLKLLVAAALFLAGLMGAAYWFQHETISIGRYTVVYYKNQCDVNPDSLSANLESLKTIPCLIRINWLERIASDMFQEYSYLPDRGVEQTRKIHKKQ